MKNIEIVTNIIKYVENNKPKKIFIDSTGIGCAISEAVKQHFKDKHHTTKIINIRGIGKANSFAFVE